MVCVLGDAYLDVAVCPCEPFAPETGIRARTCVGAGGQAANVAARAVDSTGAGDAFAAGYLLGGVGVGLGLQAAARAVGRMGAMP